VLPLLDGTGDGVVCRLFGLLPVQEKTFKRFPAKHFDAHKHLLQVSDPYAKIKILENPKS